MTLEYWVVFGWRAELYSKEYTLMPNRVQGAIFDLVGSFGINIRGDLACVPLSLEGLSEATTCKPHRTCSMWMTCICASTKYARARELTEFDGVQYGGACDFLWSSSRMDRFTCSWNGDTPPSNPSSWVCCRPSLLKNEVNHGTTSTCKGVQDWRPHFRYQEKQHRHIPLQLLPYRIPMFDDSVEGLVIGLVRIAKLNGWLQRSDNVSVWVAVHLVHNHTATQHNIDNSSHN